MLSKSVYWCFVFYTFFLLLFFILCRFYFSYVLYFLTYASIIPVCGVAAVWLISRKPVGFFCRSLGLSCDILPLFSPGPWCQHSQLQHQGEMVCHLLCWRHPVFNTCECICQAKLMFLCPFCLHTDQRNVEKTFFFPPLPPKRFPLLLQQISTINSYCHLYLSNPHRVHKSYLSVCSLAEEKALSTVAVNSLKPLPFFAPIVKCRFCL